MSYNIQKISEPADFVLISIVRKYIMKVYNFVIKKDSKNFYLYFKQMYPSLLTIYKKHEVYKFE